VRSLVALVVLLVGCGDDAKPQSHTIGGACDLTKSASDQCPGGTNARCFSPGLSCGPGFCSQACDAQDCPAGSTCIGLTRINSDTLQSETLQRCFLPCTTHADCGTPDGRLYCDATYHVCSGGGFLGNFGSVGGHLAGGAACVTPPLPVDSPPRLVTSNVRASDPALSTANEVSVAVDPQSGRSYLAFNANRFPVAISSDGQTFRQVQDIDPDNAGDPQLAIDAMGRVYFAHLAFPQQLTCNPNAAYPGGDEVHIESSDDGGNTWTAPKSVTPGQYVNSNYFIDKPWLVTGPGGSVYVASTAFTTSSTTAANDIVLSASHDRGATWSSTIVNDGTADRQHGRSLVMLAVDSAGTLYATWWEDAGDPLAPAGLVWMSRSTDGGASFLPNVQVTALPVVTFDDPQIAVSPDGAALYIVYQRLATGAVDVNDVMATVSLAGGPFGPPVKVNDDPTCATHFHAAAATNAAGDLYVIWYDNRYGDGRVMWSRALRPAGGAPLVFSPNGQVTDHGFPFTTTRLSLFLGDYLSLTIAGDTVYAAWTDNRNAGEPLAGGGKTLSSIYYGSGPLPP
jgi:hypothetical protein